MADFASLKAEVASMLGNRDDDDIDTLMANAVRRAEERFNEDLRVREMMTTVTLSLVDGRGDLPGDYLAFVAPDGECVDYDFAVDGDVVWVNPQNSRTPSDTAPFTYYAKIPALTVGAGTNWLLTKQYSLYLYATCLEGALVLEADGGPMTAKWQGFYSQKLDRVRKTDLRARFNTRSNARRRARP